MNLHRLLLLVCITFIFAIGLAMVFNTSSAEILDRDLDKSTYHALIKQILYALAGLVICTGVWFFGYQNLLKLSFPLLILFSFFLLLVFVPGIGVEANGARRWIGVGGLSFQPSEFIKYLVPAYTIQAILNSPQVTTSFREFLKLIGIVSVPMFLIFLEPNNGTVGIIGLSLLILFLVTQVRFKYWAIPVLLMIVVGGTAAYNMPHVSNRIKVYMNPELDLKGKGHQPHQAKIATGSGQLVGKGFGQSLQKLNYLPEAQNDYIGAIFAEEFGFLGMIFLITLYMLVAYLGFSIASHTPDKGGFYFAIIVVFLISIQAFLNLGVVSGLLPSTGLNLPFISQGGSSLIANMIGVTLLLNIDYVGARLRMKEEGRKMMSDE